MGRWFLLIIVVVIAISPGMVFLYVSRERPVSPQLEVRREASYQSALQAYSKELRPGLTRKDVAEYLGKKGIHLGKHLLLEQRGAFADLVEIGREEHPWYCSESLVYVAFEFSGTRFGPPKNNDVLERVSIFRQLGGCL
jgi:hypothetical protein